MRIIFLTDENLFLIYIFFRNHVIYLVLSQISIIFASIIVYQLWDYEKIVTTATIRYDISFCHGTKHAQTEEFLH